MSPRPLLRTAGLSKAFAAPVLKDIELSVARGEVVALTGENGAGKSTLSKIIAGLLKPDSGEMRLDGARYAPATRAEAERAGVRMVLQELSLIDTLSVAENVCLAHLPSRLGFIDFEQMKHAAHGHLARVGLGEIDPARPVREFGIGQQQLMEIARGLIGNVRLLILDEPTAMLTESEVARFFGQIAQLKARDVGVIYISHRLDEIRRIADRVVVLRDGTLVFDRPTRESAHDDVVRAMVGKEQASTTERPRRARGKPLLRVAGLSRGNVVRQVSFDAHAGEVLGIAGLVGSGRSELLRLIFGADRKDAGEIYTDDSTVPAAISSPADAVRLGIGMLTEDRKSQGLLLPLSININTTLASLGAVSQRGWLSEMKETQVAQYWSERLRIRFRDPFQPAAQLSGGNQQKVLLARWLHRDCNVLLLDEPTRGVDIGARNDIYAELDSLAAAGRALIVVSSDLQELMLICDRIAVMSGGSLVQTFERGKWSEEALLSAFFTAYGTRHSAGTVA